MSYFTGYFGAYFDSGAGEPIVQNDLPYWTPGYWATGYWSSSYWPTPNVSFVLSDLPYWAVGYWATGYWSPSYWPTPQTVASSDAVAGAKKKPRTQINAKWNGLAADASPLVTGKVLTTLDDWTGSVAAAFTPRDDYGDVFLFAYAKAA